MTGQSDPFAAISSFHDELTAIRRDIHRHPEIGMTEHRTAELVARELEKYGIETHRGVGKTGVVGVLRVGNGHKRIGLRADMDALPIIEATGKPYASVTPGVMHACGHDGHTTMLLGAARYLAATKRFSGTVHLIFQPGEEGMGGALAMLDDGLFERFPCDEIYGMHNWPGQPIGEFAIAPGPAMAGGAFFDIKITGRGAHGARPENAADPVIAAAHLTTALQTIVARNIPPFDMGVVSVTKINCGDAYNVIPERATLGGTVRAMTRTTLEAIEAAMRRVVAGTAAALDVKAEVDFRIIFAPLINDRNAARELADAAADVVGAARVDRSKPPASASEDFSFMVEKVPGAYINLGNGETSAPVHNDRYDFDDRVIPYGAATYARVVERRMPVEPGAS
jgi:hippurate hydrolase